jgi:predicted RND superfamily exporter protein
VVVKAENVFDPATFSKIGQLAENASDIEGVRRVISLPGIKKDVETGSTWSLDKFATMVTPVAVFNKNLISEDHKATLMTLVLEDTSDRTKVIQDVDKMIVIAVLLFFLFRNLACLVLPLTCVTLALVWTFGLMALTKTPLSMMTMIVPVFLIAVGTAYCLHIGSEYLSYSQTAESRAEASFLTFSTISFPTVLAVVTTAIGLGSLLVNRIVAIREFAFFSCFGMFSLMIIVLTLFPAALALFPLPKKKADDATKTPTIIDRFLGWIVHLDLHKQKITLPILGIFVAFCIIGIFRIQVETSPVEFFKKDTAVSRHFHDIYKDLSGSFPVNVVMASQDDDYFEDPDNLAEIAELQEFLETLPGVDKVVSFAEYLKLVNYASNQFDPQYYTLPEEDFEVRMLMNNYRIMLGEDMFTRFMNYYLSKTNILLFTHISSSRDFLETREKILAHVQENFSKDLTWDVTGLGMVVSASSHLLTKGQVKRASCSCCSYRVRWGWSPSCPTSSRLS